MLETLLTTFLLTLAASSLVWAGTILFWRVSVVDAVWGLGFIGLSLFVVMSRGIALSRPEHWILTGLVSAWGIRLSVHLALRYRREGGEDRRYEAMRLKRGVSFRWQSLFLVFWLQAIVMWLISLPLQFALSNGAAAGPAPFSDGTATGIQVAGVMLWMAGFFFESVADWQLMKFRGRDTSGAGVLNSGLWKFTRHPNYFGEFLLWWGIFLFSAGIGAPAWTIVSPLLLTVLLLKFSGVGLLEKGIEQHRPEYREYIRTTSSFIPWFPTKPSGCRVDRGNSQDRQVPATAERGT